MKCLLFTLFLLMSPFGNAQSTATGNCWKCQLAYLNQSNSVVERCQAVIKSSPNLNEINLATLILARHQMNIGEHAKARKLLNNCSFDGLFFPAIKLGLLGDTYAEQGNYTEAYTLYRKSAEIHSNNLTTPYYLYKAHLCAKKLDSLEIANKLLSTITSEFRSFGIDYYLKKHLTTRYIVPFPIHYDSIAQPKSLGIGTISGRRINEQDYLRFFRKNQEIADRISAQQQVPPVPIDEDAIWSNYTKRFIIDRETEILGLTISEEELESYILGTNGFTVMEELRLAFTNPETGEYDQRILSSRIREMQESDDPSTRGSWQDSKEYYIEKRRQEKYFEHVQLINYRTKLELEFLEPSTEAYSIEYSSRLFRSINDDSIHFETEDLRTLYDNEKHKKTYFNPHAYVGLQFLSVPLTPSKKDSLLAQREMEQLRVAFSSSSNDSNFVMENSDMHFYSSGPYSTTLSEDHGFAQQLQTYPREMDSIFLNAKVGEIVGPYWYDTTIMLAKIIGHTYDSIRARHLLLPPDSDDGPPTNMIKAKELLAQLTNDNFDKLVQQYSIDDGSSKKGGDLGYFFFAQMVQPFAVFCTEKPIGEFGIVESQFGIHIVQVTDRIGQRNPKAALIVKRFAPSSFTLDSTKHLASTFSDQLKGDFESKTSELETFASTVTTLLRPIHINDSKPILYGFQYRKTEDEVLRFVFNPARKKGDHVFIHLNDEIVIVLFETSREVGILDFNNALDKIRRDYIENEKYSILSKQMALSDYSKDTAIRTAIIHQGDHNLNKWGYEPHLICEILQINNTRSFPIIIRGFQGVYKIYSKTKVSANLDLEREEKLYDLQKGIEGLFSSENIIRALENDARIIDNRRLYRLGIRK